MLTIDKTKYFDPNWVSCPSCGIDWTYIVDSVESLAIAVVDWGLDRTVAYRCPECDDQWPVKRL